MIRLRNLFALAALILLASTFVACGGGDDSDTGGGASGEDPQKVLDETFSPDNQIDSADLDLNLDVQIEGSGDEGGSFTASLTGPIDGSGEGFPKFDLDATLSGEGGGESIDFEGGATSTGDAAFVSYKGTDYEVPNSIFSFISKAYTAGQKQGEQNRQQTLPQLKQALTNLSDEGTEDVDGTETVHISGDIDVDQLVDVVGQFAEQAQALGQLGATAQLPSQEELDQLKELVESASFDVYSGVDDHLLRRLDFNLDLQEPGGSGTATFALEVLLGSVNEPQTVEAPSDAKPLQQLLDELGVGDLGALGGLGSAPGAGGTGGGSASSDQIQCLQNATSQADLQKCLQ